MDETIIEINEHGQIQPCPTCNNPHPGMAHKCTDYLKALLDKYGGHTAECPKSSWVGRFCGVFAKCGCDWDKVSPREGD